MNKLEKKFGKYAIKNLMLYVVVINIIGTFALLIKPELFNSMFFNPYAVLNGEVWRLITLPFMPTVDVGILMGLVLYFYYSIGTMIENTIGSFKFNVYYFGGYLLIIIISLITKFPVFNLEYLNLSIFLAFAILVPNREILLFFVLPIKIKFLALIYVLVQIYNLVSAIDNHSYGPALLILVPLINAGIFMLFYHSGKGTTMKSNKSKFETEFLKQMAHNQTKTHEPKHRCEICGRTERDDENLEFRFCSKCTGNYEYCSDHLFKHEHK